MYICIYIYVCVLEKGEGRRGGGEERVVFIAGMDGPTLQRLVNLLY